MTTKHELGVPGALGLALLYASAHYFPLLRQGEVYFQPGVLQYVVWPTAAAVLILTPLILAGARLVARFPASRGLRVLALAAVTLFSLIAVKSLMEAADFSWMIVVNALGGAAPSLAAVRLLQVATTVLGVTGIAVLCYRYRSRWPQWLRFLATLGYAFVLLAAFRIGSYPERPYAPVVSASSVLPPRPVAFPSAEAGTQGKPPRRVIWVIFDEMDYGKSLGNTAMRGKLPNFSRLSDMSVSARQAYSPARDTEASVPALLMGQPVSGMHYKGVHDMDLIAPDGRRVPFMPSDSVFTRVPGGPQAAAIAGYYHPYCEIFTALASCHSMYLGNAGRWYDGLAFFSQPVFSAGRWVGGFVQATPAALWRSFDPMFRITDTLLQEIPQRVADDRMALTFIHLNLPHLPGGYAQKVMGMPQTADDHAVYDENLVAADRVLGDIVARLQARPAGGQKLLLIVSSDHWHRLDSPEQARPIPFMAWEPGESAGIPISQPISTVHTAALALDFLDGKVNTPADIAAWWQGRAFYPTWIPPKDYEF